MEQEDPKLTSKEFAQKVKAKYPEYKDVDDDVLTQKMLEKYPEYKDSIADGAKKKSGNWFRRLRRWIASFSI